MSAGSLLLRGRAAAESLMLDTCTITHVTGAVTDPDTGVVTATTSVVYSGKCKVQRAAAAGASTDVGEAKLLTSQLQVHTPMSAAAADPDDLVTIGSSALDADLAGRVFTIRGLPDKSYLTARRYAVQELSS
jgi:hypothetical protein